MLVQTFVCSKNLKLTIQHQYSIRDIGFAKVDILGSSDSKLSRNCFFTNLYENITYYHTPPGIFTFQLKKCENQSHLFFLAKKWGSKICYVSLTAFLSKLCRNETNLAEMKHYYQQQQRQYNIIFQIYFVVIKQNFAIFRGRRQTSRYFAENGKFRDFSRQTVNFAIPRRPRLTPASAGRGGREGEKKRMDFPLQSYGDARRIISHALENYPNVRITYFSGNVYIYIYIYNKSPNFYFQNLPFS